VIAYGRGGVLESVVDGKSGLFFQQQTAESLTEAVQRFDASASTFAAEEIRRNALRFATERFRQQFTACVEARLHAAALPIAHEGQFVAVPGERPRLVDSVVQQAAALVREPQRMVDTAET